MEIDPNIPSFFTWLWVDSGDGLPAVLAFAGTVLVLVLLALMLSWLTAAFRHGPLRAFSTVGRGIESGTGDAVRISPRRVYGLAWLAAREAMRRRIWVVLVIFGVILMFANWFLDPNTDSPAELYLNFVLTSTTLLLLLLALFMSVFSLPGDIKNKTIFTVATKPVRPSEMVLGRMAGFTAVGSLFLVVMAVASYVFVNRSLNHTHAVLLEDLTAVREQGEIVRYTGVTTDSDNHRHSVSIELGDFSPGLTVAYGGYSADEAAEGVPINYVSHSARQAGIRTGQLLRAVDGRPVSQIADLDGALLGSPGSGVQVEVGEGTDTATYSLQRTVANFETEASRNHTHPITAVWEDGEIRYQVGREQGLLNARVPVWGSLRFRNPQGDPDDASSWRYDERGINVGKMWTYRSYIRGNTLAAAIWTFEGIREEDYPDYLPLDLTLSVFRGHKGEITEGISGSITVRNPQTQRSSRERVFVAREFQVDRLNIPRQLTDSRGAPLDLFEDLVTEDGEVEIWLRCINPGQYFGMAQADVYIRAPDASYTWNFVKGYLGIWLQMVLVIALGVLFSTFLSGPVGMILTLSAVLMGLFTGDIANMTLSVVDPERSEAEVPVLERYYGGGPLEALYRIVTQKNLTADLEMNETLEQIVKHIDIGVMWSMRMMLHVLPDLSQFDNVTRLAHGFNIWGDTLWQQAATAAAFILCAYLASCFILRSRELAAA